MRYPEPNLPDPGRKPSPATEELKEQILHDIAHPTKTADRMSSFFAYVIVGLLGVIIVLFLLWVIVKMAGGVW